MNNGESVTHSKLKAIFMTARAGNFETAGLSGTEHPAHAFLTMSDNGRGACEFANAKFAASTNKNSTNRKQDTVMKIKNKLLGKITLGSGLAVALAFAMWMPGAARAAEDEKAAHGSMQMDHIMTQAQAEALKPGDSMSMTCTMCKSVMIQKVTKDNAHVKMMSVGEKVKCRACDGTVEIVATGKGEGKDAEVKHVCSKCGDDAMFCSAVKPGAGSFYEKQKEIESR